MKNRRNVMNERIMYGKIKKKEGRKKCNVWNNKKKAGKFEELRT